MRARVSSEVERVAACQILPMAVSCINGGTTMTAGAIHWGRNAIAAVLSEVLVVVVLTFVILTHRYVVAPGRAKSEYEAFVDRASALVAPSAAGVAVFLS